MTEPSRRRYTQFILSEFKSSGSQFITDPFLSSGQCPHLSMCKSGTYCRGITRYRCNLCGAYFADEGYIVSRRHLRVPLILPLYKEGMNSLQIAKELGWSRMTVYGYFRIFKKFGVLPDNVEDRICNKCKHRQAITGKKLCTVCRDYWADFRKRKRAKVIHEGK